MTVYVVHPVKEDMTDARRFGDLQFINDRYVFPDELDDDHKLPEAVRRPLWQAAKKFEPGRDYLLVGGDHVQLITICAMFGSILSSFDVIRWDTKIKQYVPVRITT